MSGEPLLAFAVSLQDSLVGLGSLPLEPGQQCRAKVETDARIVVDDLRDPALPIQNPRSAVRPVALRGNAFIPVVVRLGGVLGLDRLQPWVFAWRLIKMTMNADKTLHGHVPPALEDGNPQFASELAGVEKALRF